MMIKKSLSESFKEMQKIGSASGAVLQVVAGGVALALLSQLEIPLRPVPATMQTLGIYLMPLFLGKEKAFLASFFYLFLATLGLPVVAHFQSNALWILKPTAGYLISFPFAAYVIGAIASCRVRHQPLAVVAALVSGYFLVFFSGVLWLAQLIGLREAIIVGFVPFALWEAGKLAIAFCLKMSLSRLKGLYSADAL